MAESDSMYVMDIYTGTEHTREEAVIRISIIQLFLETKLATIISVQVCSQCEVTKRFTGI